MNKVYRTVFNEKTNTWVAVSEVTKAHGKSGVSGNVVSTVLDGVLFDKKMLAVSTAVAAALVSQSAMAANARIENGSAQWTIAVSPSGSDVGGTGSAKATGETSIAVGWDAKAGGKNSIAAGWDAKAGGKSSIAAGWDAKADGENSIAVGYGASTETNSATYYRIQNVPDKTMNNIAIGKQARSGGLQTIAFGSESVASKSQSIAFGFDAQATGDQSVALGANTRSVGDSSIAIGGDDLDSVASTVYRMTSPSADNDAYNDTPLAKQYRTLTGQNLVNFTPGNRYIGTSTGQAGVAVGVSAKAADLATAVGTKSHATGDYSAALGVGANATLANAVALGAGSTTATNATDVPSATIGAITYGGGTSPFAGSGKVVPGDQVSVGAAGFERQIKHVAPGAITAASTDAINGSQLFYVAKGLQEQITAAGGNGIHFYHVNGANTDNNYNNDGATGSKALAAGINAKAAGASSIAVGSAEVAAKSVVGQSNSEGAVAIGDSAYAAGRQAVTLGASRAEEEQAVAIGSNARSSGKASTAIGAAAVASQVNSISIGSSANAAGDNSVAIGADSSTIAAAANSVALGYGSQATRAAIDATKVQANAAPTVANNQVYALASASNTDQNNIRATVKGELGAVSVGTQNGTRQIINVAAGTADSDAVNVAQLKAVANQITTQAVATTPLTVTNDGKVTPPAAADAGKLATAGDIANAINNSGFQATAGGRLASGTTATATTVKPGQKVTFAAGNGLTVKQEVNATNGDQTYTYALDAQTVVQNAQTPVVYTDANGNKVYKHTDGNFYTQPNGGGTQVAAGDVIASMQDAAGNTTAPTTLANVKGNLADTSNATGNPSGNDRATLAAGNKGNNAATVNDVLNAGFTVQGNGTDKDFVTHGDTINFANGQGTVANVSTAGGVTTVKFDTPMTYADATGNPTSTPSNKVNLVGGTAGSPVTLGNVADGNIAAGSKEAINGGQLHDLKENGFKISDGTTTDTVKLTETVTYKGDSNIVTTVTDNQVGFKLANSITVGPATGGNPVTVDGNAGTVTGLTNKTWDPNNITSGRGATEDQLKAAQAAATSKVAAGNGISVTPNVDATTGSTTYTVAADTTTLNVGDGTGGNPAGKVTPPAAADAGKLATAGDIANAINNSGFQATAGGRLASGTTATATTVKPGQKVTFAAGNGLTVKQEVNATNGDQTYTYALDAQTVVQNAQTPVVYTDANGNKVYKHTDGNFYTQPNGGGTQVAAGDVIASMQDAAGNTTAPTTLANVKGNLADTSNATGNPSGNDRATLAAGNKGNNAATVNDVLNAGFTVQGNGTDKDFVTHGDTINFANGQGTVANVSTAGGVTTVKFDTPMTYADATGNPTSTPSNKVNLVGGTAGSPVTLGNVADGNIAAGSKEAINGGQLHDLKENGFKISDGTTTDTVKLTETVTYKGDSNIVTTVTDNQVGFKLANSITVGPATGGNPVTVDGNAGTVTGLTNKTWDPNNITSGRGATEDQLKAAQAAATSKVAAGNGISVTPNVDATTGSTTYTVAADTTTLNVGDGTGGNPAGKVITPTGADANKLATAGDIANAINNSGFNINAGGNVVGTSTATTAKPGSTLTLKAGDGLTVKQELDGNGNQSYTYALDSQSVVQNAQTPVVYTKADGTKVYKQPDGKFYDAPTGGNEVAAGDVIASMQDAAGSTTAPTTLANVKSNLADTATATTNPANNDRAALTANNKGNNAATVNDVLNAGFTVQGNGTDKDFVTHGDTINFANGQGTVANVSTTGGVTTVKFDTPMTYADAAGNPTNTPSNKVNLVGGTAGSPVTLGNVAPGTLSATSTEAVNGSQLYATNQNVAKGINFGGTTGSNNYQLGDTINVKGDSNITSTTVNGGVQLGLNPNLNVTSVTATDAAGNQTVTNGGGVTITPAAGGNPVSLTTGGLNNGGNKITNVAPGEISATSTDAVNGSQLHNAINNTVGNVAGAVENLQNRMGKLQDDSEAGTASALAAAGLPQAYLPGKSMIAVSGSTYRGQQGYAVGMSAISDSGNWIVKGTATGNSRGHFGATIGAGYQW